MSETKFKVSKSRLEAFSDGVIAIIITLMILEIKVPSQVHADSLFDIRVALQSLVPHLFAYLLSFVLIGIYWINHHQLIHLVDDVDATLLWLNLNFLFWLSLIPFPTAFIGEHPLIAEASAIYGFVCFGACASYLLLFLKSAGRFHSLVDKDFKSRASKKNIVGLILYAVSIVLAFYSIFASWFIFVLIPATYFVPDRRAIKT